MSSTRFDAALTDLEHLEFERAPARRLMRRAIELSANITAYDGVYVALAECS